MTAEQASVSTGVTDRPRRRRLNAAVLRDYGIVFSFVGLFIALSIRSDAFLTSTNLLNILDQWSPTAIIAVAGTLVFIAGGFDISVGAIFALAGIIAAKSAPDLGPWPAIGLGVAVGAGCGLLNAVLTTAGRINTFIATLATSIMIGGTATIITGGNLITVTDPEFARLGNDDILGIKFSIVIFALFSLACGFLLWRTTLGRAIYACGGNPEAARLSGINVSRVKGLTFVISGFAAGVAGIIVASRVSTGEAEAGGIGLAFDAVAGIVIGGTSILGGAGAVWRTVLGILLLALIGNGFDLVGVNPLYQEVLRGAIILAAVAVDAWARSRTK